jgi:hypothetical protein
VIADVEETGEILSGLICDYLPGLPELSCPQ